MRFDAVIFDLDGLLLDTEGPALAAGVTALAQLGHAVERSVLTDLIGVDHEEGLRRLNAHLGVALDGAALNRAWDAAMDPDGDIPAKPGAAQLLDRLDRLGLPFGVATNSRLRAAHSKLSRSPLAGRIASLTSFEDVLLGKPAPDVYLEAARRLGCAPARALAFEDSDVGVAAALASGMTVVQVPDVVAATSGLAHFTAVNLSAGALWAGLID